MRHNHEVLLSELRQQGISHPDVLHAIKTVPREEFVPYSLKNRAYDNSALPIDCQQTISQPYIVALMTQALMGAPDRNKVLEIGTGSGYQAAVLATLFDAVYTIERIERLSHQAKEKLDNLGFENIHYKVGDGSLGWEEHAPYDGILVTAATPIPPRNLIDQLVRGGLLVIPLGPLWGTQKLTLIKKTAYGFTEEILEYVRFVPLIQ